LFPFTDISQHGKSDETHIGSHASDIMSSIYNDMMNIVMTLLCQLDDS